VQLLTAIELGVVSQNGSFSYGREVVDRSTERPELDDVEVSDTSLLLGKYLWGLVDGTETLADMAAPPDQAVFRKRSQKALSAIVMSASPSQLYHMTLCDTARQAWDALRSHFERDFLIFALVT